MTTQLAVAPPRTAPGPRGGFLFGSAPEMMASPLTFYSQARQTYGDVVRFRAVPGMHWFLVCHPDDVEHILQKNQNNYRKGANFNRALGPLAGQGLLTSEGSFWLRQRRLSQPAFQRKQLTAMGSLMSGAAVAMVERCRPLAKSGQPLDIAAEMTRTTLAIASETLFSKDISDTAGALAPAVRDAFAYASYRLNHLFAAPLWMPTPGNRRFLSARRTLDRVVYDLIAERRRQPDVAHDLLGTLLAARDEETGQGMSDQQLRDEVLTLLLAGHETVAAAMSWTWFLLASHPEEQRKLGDELARVLGGRTPAVDDLPNLPFTRMVFEESMRLYPPAWGLPRQAIADDEIGGYQVPAGSIIVLCQFVTHLHPDFWQDPERFDPERFSPERSAGRPKFAYFPFGGGLRQCIGNHFAMMEGQLILATVAQHYRMRLVPGHPIEPDPTFTLRPRHGVRVTLHDNQPGS